MKNRLPSIVVWISWK
ncbi:unnamed protein product [Victoria cruziana]